MKTHRIVRASAWIASLVLALPLCAQDVPATAAPPAAAPAEAAPAEQKSFAEGTADAAEAALAGTEEASTPQGAEVAPDAAEPPADTRALDETVQELKKDVVDLNRELFVLEEELLFPANTQVAVFVSMDIGEFFALDSLTLKIDNKEVANYLYTPARSRGIAQGRRAPRIPGQPQGG
jgi:hypothetical protein